jgi:predicted Ser/Thr protein kinase
MRASIGKFEIKRVLGRGTMGEVYLAQDADLGREVAIKTILQGNAFGAESGARFEREAQAMAALNHPNIITLYDHGLDEGGHFLVMEYLDGEDLAGLIALRRMAKPDLLEALAQACEGLAYAHSRGIIHRDVKPGNILVAQREGRIVAKLMDFGIAAMDRSGLTQQGAWMGTVSYMAPEYLDTGKAAPSADLFAAGVILYEILANGRLPFTGETATGVLNAILRLPPAPLEAEVFQGIPGAILGVLEKALAKDPGARYETGGDLAAAIRGALSAPFTAASPAAAPAPTKPIVVGRGTRANCLSLRVALRQAQPGATILVLPGAYQESILVDKEVTIQGDGDCSEVLLLAGIKVEAGAALTLIRATVAGPGVALRLAPGARLRAEDACFQGSPAGGVELGSGTTASFLRCQFNGNGCAGLLALEDAVAVLEDCELGGNQVAGVHACSGARVRLGSCLVKGNLGLGVSAVDGAAVALERCAVSGNQGPGVLLHRGGTVHLARCAITEGPSLGVVCRQGAALTLEDCQIQGNALGGILLTADALAPTLGSDNRIADSVVQL